VHLLFYQFSYCLTYLPNPLSVTISCFFRSIWLTVGRILRAQSNGNNELFGLWKAWTEGGNTAKKECSLVWNSLRPPTNCDEPAIVRARTYIQHHVSQGEDKSANTDLVVKSIIADSRQILGHAILEYWSHNEILNDTKPKKRAAFGAKGQKKEIIVPAAIYSYDIDSLRHFHYKQDPGEDKISSIGQFEEVQEVKACIMPGSIICIKENGTNAWFFVHNIDLLFARLRACPCMAPPFPWLEEGKANNLADEEEKEEMIWLPVSKLWFALVCTRVESYMGAERYFLL
jgi:hypothetical protein